MPQTIETIKRLAHRAEECRALAAMVADESASKSYLQLASTYEMMAEEERRLLAIREAEDTPRRGA